jgi:hypothetical protein
MKHDCNKDVFSMKFACFFKFHVMCYSPVHNMINADMVMKNK